MGFWYNGKHSDEMKLGYAPGPEERGDFVGDFDVISNERSWYSGGEYYHSRVKSRTFTLTCYYDMITRAEREKIIQWFDRRTKGYLIFDVRPWARYMVHPDKALEVRDYPQGERVSGEVTVSLTCYSPFAELIYPTADNAPEGALDELTLLPSSKMPSGNIGTRDTFALYNPGTEIGHTIVTFSGSTGSSNLVIWNKSTDQYCAIKSGLTTSQNEQIVLTSKTGRIERITSGSAPVLDYKYHEYGYLTLRPDVTYAKNMTIGYTANSPILTGGPFTSEMVGAYTRVGGAWRKIMGVSSSTQATVENIPTGTGSESTCIVSLNEIGISKADNCNIQTFTIECLPEVR